MDWFERQRLNEVSENKKKYHDLMDEFEKIISGRSHSIVPYVTDENGKFSESKTQAFIGEFLELMDIYAGKNMLWFGRIVDEKALPGQKSFCRYMRLYLYLAVRMSLLKLDWLENKIETLPDESFNTILAGCRNFNSGQNKDNLLMEYECDGFLSDSGVISWGIEVYYWLSDSTEDTWMTPDMKRRMEVAFEQLEAESGDVRSSNESPADIMDCDYGIGGDEEEYEFFMEGCGIPLKEKPFFHDLEPWKYLHEHVADAETFCARFREFMALLYSDEVPYSYLYIMTKVVEGALDMYLCKHNISIYGNAYDMADAVIYIRKAMEKTDMLYRMERTYGPDSLY